MRTDQVGMLWQDYGAAKGTKLERPIPPVPFTKWVCPERYPDLSAATSIAVDVETRDMGLEQELGPSPKRDGSVIAGLSIAVPTGERWYFPMAHKLGGNLPAEHVLRWAKANLTRPKQSKVGANILYDLDFLAEAGVDVQADRFDDVLVAEPVLDELLPGFDLDRLLARHLGTGKQGDELLYDWCSKTYGGNPTRDSQAKNIWRAPVQLVGPYAEGDTAPLFDVLRIQQEMLARENLEKTYDLERRLIPCLLAMRRRGIRVDTKAAGEFIPMAEDEIRKLKLKLGSKDFNVNSKDDLVRLCKQKGIEYPITEKKYKTDGTFTGGNPSFVKKWLENHPHQAMRVVTEVRSLEKLKDTFVQGYILDHNIAGRIYAQFNQLRGNEFGTVSGRFSSSNPNLQNIPTRTELGKAIRAMFLPEEDEDLDSLDWSQIEFRFLTHYAIGVGAEAARERYRRDPATDFHVMVCELVNRYVPMERGPAKNINFGFVYGMGVPLLCSILGISEEQGWELLNGYHNAVPFVKRTYNAAMARARDKERIITFGGRRRRFPGGDHANAALNALLQGSAADVMKLAMVLCWEAGLFSPTVLGAPLATVHDELVLSVPRTRIAREAVREVKRIMETCYTLKVPLYAEHKRGPDWGHCLKIKDDELLAA